MSSGPQRSVGAHSSRYNSSELFIKHGTVVELLEITGDLFVCVSVHVQRPSMYSVFVKRYHAR